MMFELEQADRDLALEYLHRGRFKVMEKEPFFGYCAFKLGLVEKDDIPTLMTDGQRIFYNSYYVLTCKDETYGAKEYATSSLLHEILHNILLHCEVDLKKSGYDYLRANAAMDHAVNIMIKRMGYPVHKNWRCDESYEGLTWREIYEKLPPDETCQCQVEKQEKPDGDEKGEGEGKVEFNEWEKIIVEAAQFAEAMGNVPAFVERMVRRITKPRVDWRAFFYRFMSQVKKGDYSFRRPNKRYLGRGLILPSLHTYTARALVAIDVSGSTWAFLERFWTEVWGIMKSLGLEIDVILCDATIQDVVRLQKPEDLFKLKAKGGGGTDFRPVFEFIAKGYTSQEKNGKFRKVKRPEVLAFFTDTFGMYPEQAPDYPVLWCAAVPPRTGNIPPFGQLLYLPN